MQLLGVCDVPVTWVLVCGCGVLVYMYGKWRQRLLRDHGIRGPAPDVYLGNLRVMMKKGVDLSNKVGRKYGRVYGVYLGGIPVISVTDVSVLRQIFVKDFNNFVDRLNFNFNNYPLDTGIFFSDGDDWLRLRHIMSPTFSGGKLRQMVCHMNESAETLTSNFCKAADEGDVVKLKVYFGGFSMDVIASTAFGISVDSQNNFDNEFVNMAKKTFDTDLLASPLMFVRMLFPGSVSLLSFFGFSTFPKEVTKFFVTVIKQMIEQRKQDAQEGRPKRNDFLQLLLGAEDDGESREGESEAGQAHPPRRSSKKMSTDELIGQAFLFFIAGYETTATTLHYAAHCLAVNPDVQERVYDEIESVLGEREPDYDNIGELVYLDHVVNETLRLYPPVAGLTRQVKKTTTINGYTLPEGATVNIPVVLIHRDPEYFSEPLTFNPDRWEQKAEMDPLTFIPFGYGPRNCIGMRLALIEVKIALIHVIRKIKFVRLPDTPEMIQDFSLAGVLQPKTPLTLRVERR